MPLAASELLDPMPETKSYFVRRLKRCKIDIESFATPLSVCTMEGCQGMCCYDGVCLDEDEERYIAAVVRAHPKHFEEVGVTPENAFEDALFLDVETRKTATKPCTYKKRVGFPEHFEKASCVFRHKDGRCSLQGLAMEHGEHPWAYKPMSCWLHPISLERDGRTIIWLPRIETDHLREEGYPGYAPYTHCGRECAGGVPAYKALKDELKTLGAIVGRDVYGEIKAAVKAMKS
ncbi:MAG: hypothetical protein RLY93_06325 [Sumerlaeia bacterium]